MEPENHYWRWRWAGSLVIGLAGLPGFFLIIDEPEKSSVVCPGSGTVGMGGKGAIE